MATELVGPAGVSLIWGRGGCGHSHTAARSALEVTDDIVAEDDKMGSERMWTRPHHCWVLTDDAQKGSEAPGHGRGVAWAALSSTTIWVGEDVRVACCQLLVRKRTWAQGATRQSTRQ